MGWWGGTRKGYKKFATGNIGEKPEAKGRIYLKEEVILKAFQSCWELRNKHLARYLAKWRSWVTLTRAVQRCRGECVATIVCGHLPLLSYIHSIPFPHAVLYRRETQSLTCFANCQTSDQIEFMRDVGKTLEDRRQARVFLPRILCFE